MDTRTLVEEAKIRFSTQTAKDYLHNKFSNKLIVAEQNGLWKIDASLIAFLESTTTETVIMIDEYKVPVCVNTKELLDVVKSRYHSIMTEWYNEYQKIENKR